MKAKITGVNTYAEAVELDGTPQELAEFFRLRSATFTVSAPSVNVPTMWTWPLTFPNVCAHEYPNPWFELNPPNCKKCGQVAWMAITNWNDGTIATQTSTTVEEA